MYHNLYSVFEARVKAQPEKTAVIENENALTYGQLQEQVNALADAMQKKGIQKGSKLAFLITNSIEYVKLLLVCHRLGIIAVLCNYHLSPEEIVHHFKISGTDAIVLPSDYQQYEIPVNDLGIDRKRCFIAGDSDDEFDGTYQMVSWGDPQFSSVESVGPEDDAVYIFTGGTTGEPKAAIHTYQSLLMNTFLHHHGVNPYGKSDIFLNYAPLYHWGGFSILWNILAAGGCFIILKRFDAEEVYRQIIVNKVSHIFVLPVGVVSDLKKIPGFCASDMRSVRSVNLGGVAGNKGIIQDLFDIFPNAKVTIGYGMTENVCSIVQVLTKEVLKEHPEFLDSVGKPAFECDVKLIGSAGHEVIPGETGELYASSLSQFKGYLGKTSPCVNGYFPTGDLFRQDDDGNYYFVDRSKDMIRSGGENIYCVEVERMLASHEAVEECAVVAIPHIRYEESVGAAVYLRKGYRVSEQDLKNYCRMHMAHYKCPKRIRFYKEGLPKTALGKPDKKRIREDFI